MKNILKEWYIDAPWGKLALVSWGCTDGAPVLLVHGRQDSVATFVPILDYLPENCHYVGVDLPGHGKSDPFPIGVMLTRFHFLIAVDLAVRHLQWEQFVYIGHSMGCDQGLFYNAIYPQKVTRFVFFDPLPSLQRLQVHEHQEYYKTFYADYYDNYNSYNSDDRVYTKRKALDAVMRARGLNEEQAELVLARNLKKIGEDAYSLTWDRRLKYAAPQNYPTEYYRELFSSIPTTVVVSATDSTGYEKGKPAMEKLVEDLKSDGHLYIKTVEGNHDVHLIRPELVAKTVLPFLDTDFSNKCKL